MTRLVMALAALATLTAGATTTAKAVEFGVGPDGVYVGPDRYRHHEYYNEGYGRDCRVVTTRRTNRFGEDETIRKRICD